MNRKILLLITCIVLQLPTMIFADNWTAVFTALNGAFSRDRLSTSTASRLLVSFAKTPEGSIAIKYVSGQALSKSDSDKYEAALEIFKNGGSTTNTDNQPTGDAVAANWNAAIAAFGTAENVYKKVTTITRAIPNSVPTTAAHYKDAQVVLQWLQGATLNPTDAAQLNAAFQRAAGYPWNATNDVTNMATAAAALKAQIDAAIRLYNTTVGVSGSGVTTRYVLPA